MTLPARHYALQYGTLYGSHFVEARSTAKGIPHGLDLVVLAFGQVMVYS